MRTAILLTTLLFAGCVDDATNTASEDGSGSAKPEAGSSCRNASRSLLSWSSPGGAQTPPDEELPFEVEPGASTLDLEWTDPRASAGGYSVRIADPSGDVTFERSRDGASAGGSIVSVSGNSASHDNTQSPPPVGVYTFTFHADGPVDGASLLVSVAGCY